MLHNIADTRPLDIEVATVPAPRTCDRLRIAVDATTGAPCVTVGRVDTDPVELDPHAALVMAEALRQASTMALGDQRQS